jgi:hypothetical protein
MKYPKFAYAMTIIIAFMLFEIFSFSASYKALEGLWNMSSWSFLLAFAFCGVDLGGLLKMWVEGAPDEEAHSPWLFSAWLLSALGDTYLTYLALHSGQAVNEGHILIQSGVLTLKTVQVTIPVIVSILTWLIQVALVLQLEKLAIEIIPRKFTGVANEG